MEQQETRGVGRPSQGKQNVTLSFAPDVMDVLKKMPAGKRSAYIENLVRNDQKKGQN